MTISLSDLVTDSVLDKMFTAEYRRSADPVDQRHEALGILISVWTEWSGIAILHIFASALEDANYHDEARFVRGKMMKLTQDDEAREAFYNGTRN